MLPADSTSSRIKRIELMREMFSPVSYDSGSKRMMSSPSPSGITTPRRIQSARKMSTSLAAAVG